MLPSKTVILAYAAATKRRQKTPQLKETEFEQQQQQASSSASHHKRQERQAKRPIADLCESWMNEAFDTHPPLHDN
jgi:hypothetical protein